jgi:tetrahydromethanopterin S-methyltransferase subunit H
MTFKERLGVFETEQKVCEIGGVKFGGQPGDYPTVVCSSIFQKGDRIFEGKRKEGFNEKRAGELLKTQDKLWAETGVPGMADIVANTGKEFKLYVDFVTTVSDMPFCVDAWKMKPKLEGVAYCAEKGLLDRMFYNSLTVWEEDLETEIREISQMGVKHVLLVAFDMADQMPSGRITGTQKLLDAIEKVGAEFESIFVDTSVMNGPATALCGIANRMIKEKWGFPGPVFFHVPRHDILRTHGRCTKDLSGCGYGRCISRHSGLCRDEEIAHGSKSSPLQAVSGIC